MNRLHQIADRFAKHAGMLDNFRPDIAAELRAAAEELRQMGESVEEVLADPGDSATRLAELRRRAAASA
jgi:hypothetical protein